MRLILVALALLFVAGCNYSSSVSISNESTLELYQLDVVDTYGNNSQFDPIGDLAISPYISDGEFEWLWDLHANTDYFLDFYINDKPSLSGSQLIFTDYCRPGNSCDLNPILYCEYQDDFDVICENVNGEIQVSNIDHLVTTIPQTLYLILDVCDTNELNCGFQAIPVIFE